MIIDEMTIVTEETPEMAEAVKTVEVESLKINEEMANMEAKKREELLVKAEYQEKLTTIQNQTKNVFLKKT
jgi:hypothetical protein